MDKQPITLELIKGAERLLGADYTDAERSQMLENLDGQVAAIAARRAVRLENADPPATRFDPRLPGFDMPNAASELRMSKLDIPLPQSDDDIAFAPLTCLSHWLETRQISSERLTSLYLDRIDSFAPDLECFALVARKLAQEQAIAADERIGEGKRLGPLDGVPYGLKDIIDTAGIATEWGAEPFQGRTPKANAKVTQLLADAGAVLLGKTAVGALAYGDIWNRGICRNPWNLNEGSSGSSAGSASAVAAGLCGFAIGTETLGSIVSPSERCGTTGLRPTFGRVSRTGAMALCWSLDKIGPICRGVEDTGIVLSVLNAHDESDLGSIAAPFVFDARKAHDGLRIGYLEEAFGDGATKSDHDALDAAKELAGTVQIVSLEDLPYNSLLNILFAEASAAFEEITLDNRDDLLTWQDDAAWPNTFRKARFLSAVDHVQLDRLRFRAMRAVDRMMKDIDILIGPYETGPMLVVSNFTGHPCLHMRAGFENLATRANPRLSIDQIDTGTAHDGPEFSVPRGISLWGNLFEEEKLLRFGIALEKRLNVASERPAFPG